MENNKEISVRNIPPVLWDQHIDVLNLKTSVSYRLQKNGIKTLGDLDKTTDFEILNFYRFGRTSITELNQKLKTFIKSYFDFKLDCDVDDSCLIVRIAKISKIFKENKIVLKDLDEVIDKYTKE